MMHFGNGDKPNEELYTHPITLFNTQTAGHLPHHRNICQSMQINS